MTTVFAQIAAGEIEADFVHQDEHCVAFAKSWRLRYQRRPTPPFTARHPSARLTTGQPLLEQLEPWNGR